MTQSSCKRDTKSKSHPSVKLAPVEFSHVNTPLLAARHAIASSRKRLCDTAGNTETFNVCTWLESCLNSQKVPVSNPKHVSSRYDDTAKIESFSVKYFCLGIDSFAARSIFSQYVLSQTVSTESSVLLP